MKILLIFPGGEEDPIYPEEMLWLCEPLGLEYQAAAAKLDGHRVDILDLRIHKKGLERRLSETNPDLVGLTGYTQHTLEVLDLSRRIKSLRPEAKVVVGGHHATVRPRDFFIPQIDFVVSGEGVETFRSLLRGLEKGGFPQPVPGLWIRQGEKFEKGGQEPILDLEALPCPDREINRQDRAHYRIGGFQPAALIRMSEGCVFNCSFCPLWRLMGGRYLVRSIPSIIEELGRIREKAVHIVDNEPWLNPERMMDLARAIAKAGIEKTYITYCRVDTLIRQKELLRAWREIGLYSIFLGIEAITERELKEYNKKTALFQIEEALENARELGILVHSAIILRPDYTLRDFKRIRRFVQRHGLDHPAFGIITPLPGTDLWQAKEAEIIERLEDGSFNWTAFDCRHPVTETALPRAEFMAQYERLQRELSKPLPQAYH